MRARRSGVWVVALVLSLPALAPAQQIAIGAFAVPTYASDPYGIAAGPDGALWFTEFNDSGKIGRITPAGVITEYVAPTPFSGPHGITAGPDAALWFTEYYGNKVGRVTTAGAFSEYPLPSAFSYPFGIVAGPDGALWFTKEATASDESPRLELSLSTLYRHQAPVRRESRWDQMGHSGSLRTAKSDGSLRPESSLSFPPMGLLRGSLPDRTAHCGSPHFRATGLCGSRPPGRLRIIQCLGEPAGRTESLWGRMARSGSPNMEPTELGASRLPV